MKVYTNRKKVHQHHRRRRSIKSIHFGTFIYRLLLVFFSCAMVLAYLSVFINPAKIWIFIYFGLYVIPIFIINLILLFIGLLKQSKGIVLSIIVLAPALLFSDNFFKIGKEQKEFSGDSFTVLTYNVGRYAQSSNGESYARTVERVSSYLAEQNADIVCLQEFKLIDTSRISSLFPSYEYSHFSGFKDKNEGYFGNITLSNYPLFNSGDIKFRGSTNLSLYDDIITPIDTIRVYNCHLESYSISFTSIIKRLYTDSDLSEEFMQLHGILRDGTLKRGNQIVDIKENIDECHFKTLLCGDFNESPVSYSYHTITKDHTDTFLESGDGMGGTYSFLWPLLRIDYVLIPDNLESSEHIIDRINYSDHYPVITKLYRKQENND